jgi:hypothetical protein
MTQDSIDYHDLDKPNSKHILLISPQYQLIVIASSIFYIHASEIEGTEIPAGKGRRRALNNEWDLRSYGSD